MTSEIVDLSDSMLRLEELLAEAGDEAMLLSELDGFLCGLVVSPEPVSVDEWWPFPWLADERGQVHSGQEELAELIMTRLAEVEDELANGQYAPLYEVDDESDEVVWQVWLAGFQQAMQLRFELWDDLLRDISDDMRGQAAMRLASALMLAAPENIPDDTAGEDEWAEYDEAAEAMPENLAVLATVLYELHHAE